MKSSIKGVRKSAEDFHQPGAHNHSNHMAALSRSASGFSAVTYLRWGYYQERCYTPVFWCPCPDEEAPADTCKGTFLNKRKSGKSQIACEKQIVKKINKTTSLPVYWIVLGQSWLNDMQSVTDRLDDASNWFDKYCIDLDLRNIDIDNSIAAIAKKSARKKAEKSLGSLASIVRVLNQKRQVNDSTTYTNAIARLYKRLWKHLNKTGIYLLFVDDYVKFNNNRVISNASASMGQIPVTLIRYKDNNAKNIVTHELIHAFGRSWKQTAKGKHFKPPQTNPWLNSRNWTWEHGNCKNDMGNWLGRGNPDRFFLDLSAYNEFLATGAIK